MKNRTDTRPREYGPRAPRSPSSVAELRRVDALRASRGFTLVELLVVISIIAILAALLLPAISRAKVQAQKKKAQMEIGQIANAIHTYESEYSKFPVSSVGARNAMSAAAASGADFTFGTAGVVCVGPGGSVGLNNGFKTPTGTYPITSPSSGPGVNYQTNNSEVMAVLLDVEYWPIAPGVPTINQGHVKNPQKTTYLTANRAINTNSPGLGPDGVYRDPWGNPYIITVDLNYDDKARDAFYQLKAVSADGTDTMNNPPRGLNGLIPKVVNNVPLYEAGSPVMVWSAGPDKMIDQTKPANVGANQDNILSWKQ